MFNFPEGLTSAAKSNLESQLSIFTALGGKAFESWEKVIDLNLNVARASIEDSSITLKQLLAAKDPQEFFALSAAQAQPTAAKAIAYSRHLAGIAASLQADLTRTAEEQFAEAGRKVTSLVDDVSKNAPGSENVLAMFKSALGNASAGYEQFSKSTKQAVEVMEANVNTAVNQFTQTAEKATRATRK